MQWTRIFAGLAATLLLSTSAPALACGNEVDDTLYLASRDARRADLLASRGRLEQALALANQAREQAIQPPNPRAWQRPVRGGRVAVRTRIDRVIAVVIVRARGAVTTDRSALWSDASAEQRADQLLWASQTLAAQLADSHADPVLIARTAEALVASGQAGPHTLAALQSIADRDLMPDAQGFATLAELHRLQGDHQAHDRALRQCRDRAGRQERAICRPS